MRVDLGDNVPKKVLRRLPLATINNSKKELLTYDGVMMGMVLKLSCFKKNLNASKPSNQSKGLGGNIIDCRDQTSPWIRL